MTMDMSDDMLKRNEMNGIMRWEQILNADMDIRFAEMNIRFGYMKSEINEKLITIDERFSKVVASINNLWAESDGTINLEIEEVKTEINATIDQNKTDRDEQLVQLSKAISNEYFGYGFWKHHQKAGQVFVCFNLWKRGAHQRIPNWAWRHSWSHK